MVRIPVWLFETILGRIFREIVGQISEGISETTPLGTSACFPGETYAFITEAISDINDGRS